jgi:penicillin amidase
MWMRELQVALFRGEHETILAELPLRERPELVLRTLAGSSAFCANRPGGCAATVNGALTAALDALGARYGADMDKWRWDQAHYAPFRHPIYDRVPVLRDLFGFRVPTDGDNYTVNRGAGRIASPTEPFAHVHGAGYRAVYDFADLDRSVFVATPGQSGHPLSRHWGDFAPLWANGKHVAIPSRVEGGSILTLRPR